MSDHNAYEDEMRLRRPYDTDDAEFSSLAEDVRSACLGAPGPEVEARHLRAIIEQVRWVPEAPVARPAGVRRSKPLRVLAKVGAAAATLALLTGSLAVAGVDLPLLPEMKSDDSRAKGSAGEHAGDEVRSEVAVRVQSAIQSSLPMLRAGSITGCEFQAAVSAAVRGEAPDTSGCAGVAEGDDNVLDPERSETSRNVQAAIEENLPRLHAGDISGCEFGAMVSAAARAIEPDITKCQRENTKTKTKADDKGSTEAEKAAGDTKVPAPASGSKPSQNSTANEKVGGKGKDAKGDATADGATGNKPEAKTSEGNAEKSQGKAQGQGKDAQPDNKPGGKTKKD
jgi:hypothetical protein